MTKKQSSDRVSRIAAKLLAKYKSMVVSGIQKDWLVVPSDGVHWGDLATLAGSCVSQDEHRGKRPTKKRPAKRRRK